MRKINKIKTNHDRAGETLPGFFIIRTASLTLQTLFTMAAGLILSVAAAYIYSCVSGNIAIMKYIWFAAAVYILAGTAGSLVSAMIVSRKDVLSLLGSKE